MTSLPARSRARHPEEIARRSGYYWRENIRDYVSKRVPVLRNWAADSLGTLGERAGSALDRARSRIDTSVRTGEERVRATSRTGGSG